MLQSRSVGRKYGGMPESEAKIPAQTNEYLRPLRQDSASLAMERMDSFKKENGKHTHTHTHHGAAFSVFSPHKKARSRKAHYT